MIATVASELEIKRLVRARDKVCQDCGMTVAQSIAKCGKTLHVHRLVPGSPYSMGGCVTVCNRCHRKRHKGPKRRNLQIRLVGQFAELINALDAYAAQNNKEIGRRITHTAYMNESLKEYLAKRGYWPPS